ncbi:serpin family protein [Evtepia sp.]|uniref:serpin family protein n=1 Tax=Evtepia sp. TaxID=2773933 RepID=UPI003F191762
MKKRIPALGLCLALALFLAGCGSRACGNKVLAEDLMADMRADVQPVSVEANDREVEALAVTEFSVRLFQESREEGENTLVSPLSVLCALAMTANGARGETMAQMETLFGMPISELNEYLYVYTQALPEGKTYQLNLANSLWIRDDGRIQVEEDFLRTNATWYDAGVYQAPFDNSTVKDINAWVSENTDGMIDHVLDRVPEETVLYLINALCFEAQWKNIYYEHQVRDGVFTTEEGDARDVELMYSNEYQYLEDDKAAGFMKFYDDEAYAFVALLPKEGVRLRDYIASLTGENLRTMLSNVQDTKVETAIPKFQSEYTVEMKEILQTLGMTDAFDPEQADLSGIGETSTGLLYINQVLHKTYIAMDEQGTKAGAATVVATGEGAAPPTEVKTVYLDRPFLYLIVDREAGLPVFMGTVMDITS